MSSATVCPKCGSSVLENQRVGLLAALSLYVGIPLPFARRHWHCKDCGARWR